MATAKQVMTVAERYIGVTEYPPNSNKVMFNTDYYGSAVSGADYPWCCAFVWDVFRIAGASKLFYDGKKTAYCPTVANWGKSAHLTVPISQGRYGDIVLFDWDGDGVADHIGFIVKQYADGSYLTIEGNTAIGNDSNGGEVMYRTRYQYQICEIIRPKYSTEVKKVTYEEWVAFMKKYQKEQADKGVPSDDDDWQKQSYDFVKKYGISDGYRPYSFITRVEAWGMLKNFWNAIMKVFNK